MEALAMTHAFDNGCYGYCAQCETEYRLGVGGAMEYAKELMETLQTMGRLDIDVPDDEKDPRLSLEALFPGDRGHMFGVLECASQTGDRVFLKAFSSLRGGIRFVPGWVKPNLSQVDYERVVWPQEQKIKAISAQWKSASDATKKARLAQARTQLSQNLWREMRSLYRFFNFTGGTASIDHLFGDRGVPGGVGECCAPKLLCAAAKANLKPLGLCEFYWGPTKKYDGKTPGTFYPCCEQRCRPILGFILCGSTEPKGTKAKCCALSRPYTEEP